MCVGHRRRAASTRFAEVPQPSTRRAPLMQRGAPWIRGAEWVPTAAPRPERARGISERGTWPRVRPGPKSVRSQALGRASGFPASGWPGAPQGTPGDALDWDCPGGRSAETGLGERGRKARGTFASLPTTWRGRFPCSKLLKRCRRPAESRHSRPCVLDSKDAFSPASYSWRSRWSCVKRGPTPAEPLCRAPGDKALPARRTSRLFS